MSLNHWIKPELPLTDKAQTAVLPRAAGLPHNHFTAISFEIFASLCEGGSFQAQLCTADLKSSDFINDGCTDSLSWRIRVAVDIYQPCWQDVLPLKRFSLNLKTLEAVKERSAHRRLRLKGLLLVVLSLLFETGDHAVSISRAAPGPLPSCWPTTCTAQFCFCFLLLIMMVDFKSSQMSSQVSALSWRLTESITCS